MSREEDFRSDRRELDKEFRALRRTKPMKRGRIKPKKRKASEFARIYGSKERVEWVKSLSCVGCGRNWDTTCVPIDNAHIETGGMGRKADYDKIVPLCSRLAPKFSCHGRFHRHGRDDLEMWAGINLEVAAAETEARWQSFLQQQDNEDDAA